MITIVDDRHFRQNYPDHFAHLKVTGESALLSREALAALADRLDPEMVEYNPGALPITVDPADVPPAQWSAAETIRRIDEAASWLTMRRVERDEDYRGLMEDWLHSFLPITDPATGPMNQKEAFVFVSSAASVTPLHIDGEHNILVQIEGTKDIQLFSRDDPNLTPPEVLENFCVGGHRNLNIPPEDLPPSETVTLAPGDAIYIPPLTPHWVKVTGEVPSISFSVTWRSKTSQRTAYLHQINHGLRQSGKTPQPPDKNPLADTLKIGMAGVKRKLGLS